MALLTQLSCFAHAIVMMGVGGLLVFNQSELKARLNDVNVFCRANVQPHLLSPCRIALTHIAFAPRDRAMRTALDNTADRA